MSVVLETDADELLSAIVSRPRTDRTMIAKTTSSHVEEHDLADAGGGGAGEVFREDREGEGALFADGIPEGRNFGEAWGVCVGRPGPSPGTAGGCPGRVGGAGSPESPRRPRRGYVEGRAQATRGNGFLVANSSRGGTARWPPGSAEGDARVGFRLHGTSAHSPGDAGVKSGHSLVTGRRSYTRAVRGYSEGIAPGQNQAHAGSLPRNAQTPEATVHRPPEEPGRVLGLGGAKAKPGRNPDVTRV